MHRTALHRSLRGLALAAATLLSGTAVAAGEVNLYSARQEALIKPLLDRFTEQSGIRVNVVSAKAKALLQRLRSEGRNSPADLLLTVDVGNLHAARAAGVLQPLRSDTLEAAVPARYRDPEGYWYALSLRARPILYARDRVDPAELTGYESLADRRWRNRLCIRSSDNIYNQSLVASRIAHDGAETTETWARGVVKNFARPPQGGDRDQIRAVAAGQCDLAVANTYYLAQMRVSDKETDRAAAEKVAVFWPDQGGRGVHVNVSGAALTAAAKNRDNARALLEFLVGPEAQRWYAERNQEYPVRTDVAWSETLQTLGRFEADTLDTARFGELNADAVKLMDRAGWR